MLFGIAAGPSGLLEERGQFVRPSIVSGADVGEREATSINSKTIGLAAALMIVGAIALIGLLYAVVLLPTP